MVTRLDVGPAGDVVVTCDLCAWRTMTGSVASAARAAAVHVRACHDDDVDAVTRSDAAARAAEYRQRRRRRRPGFS